MPLTRLLATLACSSLLAAAALAQPAEPPAAPKPPKAAAQPTQPAPPEAPGNPGPVISVEFPGGTAKQFVDAVRQAAGSARVNVIVPKEAESVPLPEISLREVATYTALQALEYAASADAGNQFSVSRLGKGDDTSTTFAIRYAQRSFQTPQPFNAPPRLETHVFSIRDLVEAPSGLEKDPTMVATTETVLNAIKAASQLDVEAKVTPPEFMFHKDSQLLIMRGTMEQLRTVESVLGQLTQTIVSRRTQAMAAAEREKAGRLQQAEMTAQMEFTSTQQSLAASEMGRATSNVEHATELVNAGQGSNVELDNARAQLDHARAQFEQVQITMRSLKERQAILEARAHAGGGPDAAPVQAPVMVAYDYGDLGPFESDVVQIIRAVLKLRGGEADIKYRVNGPNTIGVRATPAEHDVIVKALNGLRRAKANEPKLPGLDAEDLIRKGAGK